MEQFNTFAQFGMLDNFIRSVVVELDLHSHSHLSLLAITIVCFTMNKSRNYSADLADNSSKV